MVRVIYETIKGCRECHYNKCQMCYKLSRPIQELCYEVDCPLPTLEKVEQFTRYITPDKSLDCHGNCKNWQRWEYNKHINTDLGICCACDVLKFCHANSKGCEEFEEI